MKIKKPEFMNGLTRAVHKVGFKAQKHAPELLVIGGVIGFVGTTVLACKATLKVNEEVLDKTKADIDKIHVAKKKGVTESNKPYSEEDAKKDLTIVYGQTAIGLVKLYGPAVGLGVLSTTAIFTGHNVLRKRNLALAAAYTAVDQSFKDYRGRVIERFGENLDKELRYNIKTKEVEEIVVNEDGSETVVKNTVKAVDPTTISEYAVFFDESCPGWTKDPEYNKTFLIAQQEFANQKLRTKGYLFLNEVYNMLGIPQTKAGQVVGWIYDDRHPIGDNFVDFGIFDVADEKKRDFVNGYERSILLDFNVDGNIWEKM